MAILHTAITNLSTINSNISTNTTNITNLNTILTGALWNSTHNYKYHPMAAVQRHVV